MFYGIITLYIKLVVYISNYGKVHEFIDYGNKLRYITNQNIPGNMKHNYVLIKFQYTF